MRVLILDPRGTVVYDTEDQGFAGRTFPIPAGGSRRAERHARHAVDAERRRSVDGHADLLAAKLDAPTGWPWSRPNSRSPMPGGRPCRGCRWPRWAPCSSRFSSRWWLASTITRPLLQITHASEEIARGNYDADLKLPADADEVGRLAQAFTIMARQVARSHRAMRDLLANVSHDLRTPLTSISGFRRRARRRHALGR